VTNLLSVNDVELDWQEYGAGDTLILCHGYTGSLIDFSLQAEQLAADTNRRVVTLSQRGHGYSTRCGNLESYSFDILTNDLIAFIEQISPGQPVDLLGHSMGGRVALGVVLARPDLIRSLILMDTSAWSFVPPDPNIQAFLNKFLDNFDPAKGMPATFGMPNPEEDLIAAATPEEWRKEKEITLRGMDAYAAKALGIDLLTSTKMSVRDQLPDIKLRTTVLVGELDGQLAEQAPVLTAELTNADATLTVIPGAFHSPQLTHPDQWRAAIVAHISSANQ
jgi:pimeloyl-ACP methyl ester carboxylesterase